MRALPEVYREHYRPAQKRWTNRYTPRPKRDGVRIRPLIVGSAADVRISPVRSSTADSGLVEHVLIFRHGKPVYVFDHHCFSLYGWLEMFNTGSLTPPATLVRIDLHSDGLPNSQLLQRRGLEGALEELYSPPLANASFVEPAVRVRLFNRILWLKNGEDDAACPKAMSNLERLARRYPDCSIETFALSQLRSFLARLGHLRSGSFVVDWDLDFFARDMSSSSLLALMRRGLRRAAGTTLSTSPFYLDQDKAGPLIRKIVAAL